MFHHAIRAATLLVAFVVPALAHHDGDAFSLDGIVISHAHTVEVSASAHSMDVFLTIENTTEKPVTITSASVDFAAAGIFQAPSISDSGTMSVREVTALQIAPGQTLTMQPSGVHLVFHDVKNTFEDGDHFHAVLKFKGQGEVEIEVEVEHSHDDHQHSGQTS
jgi:copper(I)-binding protein